MCTCKTKSYLTVILDRRQLFSHLGVEKVLAAVADVIGIILFTKSSHCENTMYLATIHATLILSNRILLH